ncbi:nuclear pore complex protein DDB_G0274915-like [Tigriopus californicus]|uniref:nuclear pore complex protein DDB_G0274915-like n=1 Tax=Tigriopus californicus TaxID=6832 RepID=UPI0027DA90DD|nr:nuclear pore complex protein DDB_G0274915-like [Tigriopus californicus]
MAGPEMAWPIGPGSGGSRGSRGGSPLSAPMRHEVRSSGLTARLSNYIRQSQTERERRTSNPRYQGLGVLPQVHLRTSSLPRLSVRNTTRLLSSPSSTCVRVASAALTSPAFSPFRNSGLVGGSGGPAADGVDAMDATMDGQAPGSSSDRDVIHARSGLMSTLRAMSQSAGRKRARMTGSGPPIPPCSGSQTLANARISRFDMERERSDQRSDQRGQERLGAEEDDHGEEDEDDEDDDEDEEDEEEDEEDEEEDEEEEDHEEDDRAEDHDVEDESVSKRARRDSSSSVGSSLSMEMPPLFSNGVIGQTTSHLVNRETDLSLNSLLSRSQALYHVNSSAPGTMTTSTLATAISTVNTTASSKVTFPSVNVGSSAAAVLASQSSSSPAMAAKVYRSKVNEINSSLSSSSRAGKRPRQKWSSSESENGDPSFFEDAEFLREAKRRHIFIAPDKIKAMTKTKKNNSNEAKFKDNAESERRGMVFALPNVTHIVSSNLLATPGNSGPKPTISSVEAYEADQRRGVARAKNLLSAFEDEDHLDTPATVVAFVPTPNVEVSSNATVDSQKQSPTQDTPDDHHLGKELQKPQVIEPSTSSESLPQKSTSLLSNAPSEPSLPSGNALKKQVPPSPPKDSPSLPFISSNCTLSGSTEKVSDSKSNDANTTSSITTSPPNHSTKAILSSSMCPSTSSGSPSVTHTSTALTSGSQLLSGSSTSVQNSNGKVSDPKTNLPKVNETGLTVSKPGTQVSSSSVDGFTFGNPLLKKPETGATLFGNSDLKASLSGSNTTSRTQPLTGMTSFSFGLASKSPIAKVATRTEEPTTLPSLFQLGSPSTSISDSSKSSFVPNVSSKSNTTQPPSFAFVGASGFGAQSTQSLPPTGSASETSAASARAPVSAPFQFGTQPGQPSFSAALTPTTSKTPSAFAFGGSKIDPGIAHTTSTASSSLFTFGVATSTDVSTKKLGTFSSSEIPEQGGKASPFGDGSKFAFGAGAPKADQPSSVFGKPNSDGGQGSSLFGFGKTKSSEAKTTSANKEFSFGISTDLPKPPNDFSKPLTNTAFRFGSSNNIPSTTEKPSASSSNTPLFQFGSAPKQPSAGARDSGSSGTSGVFQFGSTNNGPMTKASSMPTNAMSFGSNDQNIKPSNSAFAFGMNSSKQPLTNTFSSGPSGNDQSRSSAFNFGTSGSSTGDGVMKFGTSSANLSVPSNSLTSLTSTMANKPLGPPPSFGSPKTVNFSFGLNAPQNQSAATNLTNGPVGGGLFQFGQSANSSTSSGIGGGFNFGGAPSGHSSGGPAVVNPTFGAPSASFPAAQNPPSFGASSFSGIGSSAAPGVLPPGPTFGSPIPSGTNNQMFSIGAGQSSNMAGGRQIARARRRRK